VDNPVVKQSLVKKEIANTEDPDEQDVVNFKVLASTFFVK
jgi:hypothetical protein